MLVRRHGYSPERAATLILDQIRQCDSQPCRDEVFRLMEVHGLGLDEAAKAIVVSDALKRVQSNRGLSAVDAVDFLSSCLTTMKLLGIVEKQLTLAAGGSNTSISDELIHNSTSPNANTTLLSNSSSTSTSTSSPPTASDTLSKSNMDSSRAKTNRNRPSNKKNRKTQRKNINLRSNSASSSQEESVNHNTNTNGLPSDVNAKVAKNKKALQTHVDSAHNTITLHPRNRNSPSPSGTRGKRSVGHAHMDDLEVDQEQPVSKRQRLDSI